jgi:ribosome-associated protein
LDSYSLAKNIALLSIEKKAYDVTLIEIKELASFTDYFVVCSADSDAQVKAIADYVIEEMRMKDVRVWHSEGYESLNWVLLDFVDVVCHIFRHDTRDYYNIEKLWGDAKTEIINDVLEQKVIKSKKRVVRKTKNAKIS